MNRENREEKLFNEMVDRILAGEPVEIDTDDKDLHTALEFTKKMESMRASPSQPFKSNLKAKLLQKLREKETRVEQGNWWTRTFPKRIVWQMGTTVMVILLAIGVGWMTGVFQSNDLTGPTAMPPKANDAGTMESAPGPTLMATDDGDGSVYMTSGRKGSVLASNAVTDKLNYLPGEEVNIIVYLTNNSAESIEIQQYPPAVDISDANGEVIYSFGAGYGTLVLLAGDTVEFKVVWNQIDYANNATISGAYYVTVNSVVNVSNIGVSNSVSNFNITP
jgi:hypothetical protein